MNKREKKALRKAKRLQRFIRRHKIKMIVWRDSHMMNLRKADIVIAIPFERTKEAQHDKS